MKCINCGKELTVTYGGQYHCPICDVPKQDFGKQEGWICPVCGRGVAPWVDVCPCRNDADVINVTTTTESVDLSKYYTLINDGTVPEAKL